MGGVLGLQKVEVEFLTVKCQNQNTHSNYVSMFYSDCCVIITAILFAFGR